MNDFLIGQHHVDVARNRIVVDGQTHTLQPKAMAVLCVLVEHQGQVVSIEQLMERVWRGRVVSPNTLQRNISQLRKCLGDDSQNQQVIKTHSKKGYSLELPVSSSESNAANKGFFGDDKPHKYSAWVGSIIVFLLILWQFNIDQTEYEFDPSLKSITPLTSSDEWESNASYDNRGKFVVFNRYLNKCESHLWLKDLATHKEFQLTKEQGVYGTPSWSADGNYITVTQRNACKRPQQTDEFCWAVKTISVLDALSEPQTPTSRVDCQNNPVWLAKWLPAGEITFLRESNGNASIQLYSPKTKTTQAFYGREDAYTYVYDYSILNKAFAVISLDDQGGHILDVLDSSGTLLSSAEIALPEHFPKDVALELNYHPTGEFLMVSAKNDIYRLELDGTVRLIDSGGRAKLSGLSFHPNGKSLLATETLADTDNVLLSLASIQQHKTITNLSEYKLARSTLSEDASKFAPQGSAAAFTSTRSGTRQIWLHDGELKQLSHLPLGLQTKHIFWSPSGNSLAGLSDNAVQVWQLDGTHQRLSTPQNIEAILQWFSPNEMLVNIRLNGTLTLHRFNIKTGQLVNLEINNIRWANYIDDEQLVYLDRQSRFWRTDVSAASPIEISKLQNELEQPVAVYKDGKLFGLNNARELWSYSIANDTFEVLVTLPESTRYVSDFNGNEFLITQMEQLNKDLISIHYGK